MHTVFTSASAGRGLSPGGFAAMFRRLPLSLRHVYVIRDVPRARVYVDDYHMNATFSATLGPFLLRTPR